MRLNYEIDLAQPTFKQQGEWLNNSRSKQLKTDIDIKFKAHGCWARPLRIRFRFGVDDHKFLTNIIGFGLIDVMDVLGNGIYTQHTDQTLVGWADNEGL